MKNIIALVALFLASCGGGSSLPLPPIPPATPAISGLDIWKLGRTFSEFDFKSFAGTYNPANGIITVDPSSIKLISTERQTNLPATMPLHPDQAAVSRVQTNSGVLATAVDPKLVDALVERSDGFYIGEAANSLSADQTPPEPYLTVNPVAGEHQLVHSLITKWDGTTFFFDTAYWTVLIDGDCDGFPHCTISTLTENYDRPNGWSPEAYMWEFSGGELAAEVFGKVEDDGVTIKEGFMIVRTSLGQNP